MTEMPYRQKRLRVCAVSEDQRITDWIVEDAKGRRLLGNIYVGRVERVVPGLQAAFVRIADGQMCFLPLTEARTPVYKTPGRSGAPRGGDELLVQVSREALKEKLPAVTAKLCIQGRHMLAVSDGPGIGVSSKLSGERREELRTLFAHFQEIYRERSCGGRTAAGGGEAFCPGFVVRTSAGNIPDQELEQEWLCLSREMAQLMKNGRSRTCYSLLHEAQPAWRELLGRIPGESIGEIVTDSPELCARIAELQNGPGAQGTAGVRLYEDRLLPLYKLYSLESVLTESLGEKVWMRSGGFLVIQQTEAFTAVDVNSGKCEGKKDAQEHYRRINLEAAAEIARQLRLRQLSGIILIDFINLQAEERRRELLRELSEYLKGDPAQAAVVDMTKLQIVEVTRRKIRRSLREEVDAAPCTGQGQQV